MAERHIIRFKDDARFTFEADSTELHAGGVVVEGRWIAGETRSDDRSYFFPHHRIIEIERVNES